MIVDKVWRTPLFSEIRLSLTFSSSMSEGVHRLEEKYGVSSQYNGVIGVVIECPPCGMIYAIIEIGKDFPWHVVAHEATHVARSIFRIVGEKDVPEETMAYLVEWVVARAMELKPKWDAANAQTADLPPIKA